MRTIAGAIAAAAVLLGAAPMTVVASQVVGVQLSPTTVAPGGAVYVRAFCTSGTSATVSSTAFATATMGAASSGGGLIALVTVASTTGPGAYGVHVACANGDTGDATLTVAPSGGASTGDGAMAGRPNPGLAWAGLAMIALALAMLVVLVRRRADA
jgi:hypothetical protein